MAMARVGTSGLIVRELFQGWLHSPSPFCNVHRISSHRQRQLQNCRTSTKSSLTGSAAVAPQQPTSGSKAYSRKCNVPLPPAGEKKTELRIVEDGVWVLRQEFGTKYFDAEIFCNCFIVRLRDGHLLVVSPVSLTEECEHLLSQIPGDIKHIIAPSLSPEHWVYTPALAAKHPHATVWLCPGLLEGVSTASVLNGPQTWKHLQQTHSIRVLPGSGSPPELVDDLECCLFKAGFGQFMEMTLHLKHYRAVVVADAAFARQEPEMLAALGPVGKFTNRLAGILDRLGCPIVYGMLRMDSEQGAQWFQTVDGWQGWERLFCLHFQPVVAQGRFEFSRCFDFLPVQQEQEQQQRQRQQQDQEQEQEQQQAQESVQ